MEEKAAFGHLSGAILEVKSPMLSCENIAIGLKAHISGHLCHAGLLIIGRSLRIKGLAQSRDDHIPFRQVQGFLLVIAQFPGSDLPIGFLIL